MPAWKAATEFLPFLHFGASSEAPGFPARNVASDWLPRRPWRTVGVGSAWLRLDFGYGVGLVAVFLNNASFSTVQIKVSNDPAFVTGVTTKVAAVTHPIDTRVNRRKAMFTFSPTTARYLRIEPSGALGLPYFQLGAVAAFVTTRTLPDRFWAPLTSEVLYPQMRVQLPSQAEDVTDEGIPSLQITGGADAWVRSTMFAELMALLDLGGGQRFVLFENGTDLSRAYCYRVIGDMAWDDEPVTFRSSLTFRECV